MTCGARVTASTIAWRGGWRTLITLDRDYLNDKRFPPQESPGVLVLSAPEERGFILLLRRLDQELFRYPLPAANSESVALPLSGRKLHLHVGEPINAGIRDL